MDDLLPPNSTALERRAAAASAALGDLPVPLRSLINPATCPAALLPWLAFSLSVDSWEIDWSDAQKRDTIKNSLAMHRAKGTIGAVKSSLAVLGYQAKVQEWFNQIPAGAPYTYKLLLDIDQIGIDKAAMATVINVIESAKNLRSHVDSINLNVKTAAVTSLAVVSSSGNEIDIKYGASNLDLLLEGAKNGMEITESRVDGLHQYLHVTMPYLGLTEVTADRLHYGIHVTMAINN